SKEILSPWASSQERVGPKINIGHFRGCEKLHLSGNRVYEEGKWRIWYNQELYQLNHHPSVVLILLTRLLQLA
uniref:Uncharacterized protein n=1 Tax=Megaselia scalaris TaxID=36166 RepID=T1GXT9_MEGSC